MFTLVYASSAVNPLPKSDLLTMLEQARDKNQYLDITGLLLYKDGNFMQVLEGDEAAVLRLMDSIQRDPRHHGIIVMLNKMIEEREFAQWGMAFRDLGDEDVKTIPGYSEFLNMPLSPQWLGNNVSEALTLLKVFHKMHSH